MTVAHTTVVADLVIPSDSPLFLAGVGLHVVAGVICVVAGAVAMLSRKGRGRHAICGILYDRSLTVVFATAVALAVARWAEDYVLFLLAALSFAAARLGREAMRRRWPNAARLHLSGMGASYIVLLTAFYVDNGHSLPVWKNLPPIAYWTVPSLVGVPIMLWALLRHPLARRPELLEAASRR
jgi:hypothetical protein